MTGRVTGRVLNRSMGYPASKAPIRVLQLGEGRFLRTFVDPILASLSPDDGQPLRVLMTNLRSSGQSTIAALKRQEGLYTVMLADASGVTPMVMDRVVPADLEDDWSVVVQTVRNAQLTLIVTNGTEAGLVAPWGPAWPGPPGPNLVSVMTWILWERWRAIPSAPLWVMPTELVPRNGDRLRELVCHTAAGWGTPTAFQAWLNTGPYFVNSLVDRIVAGSPPHPDAWWTAWGYRDELCSMGERYGRWWIERGAWQGSSIGWDWEKAPEVRLVDDLRPYQDLKLFLLNGAHLELAAAGLLRGHMTVRQAMGDPLVWDLVQEYWTTAQPLVPLPRSETTDFVDALIERFCNPYLDHALQSIAQNMAEKWRIRFEPLLVRSWNQGGSVPAPWAKLTALVLAFLDQCQGDVAHQGLIARGRHDLWQESQPWEAALVDAMAPYLDAEAYHRLLVRWNSLMGNGARF